METNKFDPRIEPCSTPLLNITDDFTGSAETIFRKANIRSCLEFAKNYVTKPKPFGTKFCGLMGPIWPKSASQTKLNTQKIIHLFSKLHVLCRVVGMLGPIPESWAKGRELRRSYSKVLTLRALTETFVCHVCHLLACVNLLCVCQRHPGTDPYGYKHCRYSYERGSKRDWSRMLKENTIYILHPQCHNVLLDKMLLSNAIFKSKVTTHPSLWLLKPTDSFYQTGRPWRSDYANTDPPPGSNNDLLPRDTGRGSQQPCSPPVSTQNNKTNVGFCRKFVLFMHSIYIFMCKCVFVSTM